MKQILGFLSFSLIILLVLQNNANAVTQSDIFNAQLNYQSAKTNYDNDSADYADAQDNVTQARINLQQAESALVAAQRNLSLKIRQESQAKATLNASTGELNKASNIVQDMWTQVNGSSSQNSNAATSATTAPSIPSAPNND